MALTVGGRRERLPGVLLTLGGVTFLVTLATSAPFWGEGSPQWEGGPLLAYTAALTLIALAIAATALVETRARTAQLRGTGSTVPG